MRARQATMHRSPARIASWSSEIPPSPDSVTRRLPSSSTNTCCKRETCEKPPRIFASKDVNLPPLSPPSSSTTCPPNLCPSASGLLLPSGPSRSCLSTWGEVFPTSMSTLSTSPVSGNLFGGQQYHPLPDSRDVERPEGQREDRLFDGQPLYAKILLCGRLFRVARFKRFPGRRWTFPARVPRPWTYPQPSRPEERFGVIDLPCERCLLDDAPMSVDLWWQADEIQKVASMELQRVLCVPHRHSCQSSIPDQ